MIPQFTSELRLGRSWRKMQRKLAQTCQERCAKGLFCSGEVCRSCGGAMITRRKVHHEELASVVEQAPEHDPCRGSVRLVNGFIEQTPVFSIIIL